MARGRDSSWPEVTGSLHLSIPKLPGLETLSFSRLRRLHCAFLACNTFVLLPASRMSTARSSSDVTFSMSAPWMSSRQRAQPPTPHPPQLWMLLAGKRAVCIAKTALGLPSASKLPVLAHSGCLVNVDSEGTASFPDFKKSIPSK